jgi:radical SAM-linked protein
MRLRITFAKQGALRYTGHLDLNKIWERTARRADLPLAYSQGFHPQPKIYIASALPLGFSSRAEVLDMKLKSDTPLEGLAERLQASVPPGLRILNVEPVDDALPQLQTRLIAAEYEVAFTEPVDESALAAQISALLAADSLPRERRGKPYDLRPLVQELLLLPSPPGSPTGVLREGAGGEGGDVKVFMRLTSREGATGRPEEVLDQLGVPPDIVRVERTRLIFMEESVK